MVARRDGDDLDRTVQLAVAGVAAPHPNDRAWRASRRFNYEGFGAFRLLLGRDSAGSALDDCGRSEPRSVSTPSAESKEARKRLAVELRRLADEWESDGLKEDLRMGLLLILLRLG